MMLNTLNFAHLGAWTSTWTGGDYNPSPMFPPQSPPLLAYQQEVSKNLR
jgi:type IV secretion system protein VirB4